jgi:hypothetical protein
MDTIQGGAITMADIHIGTTTAGNEVTAYFHVPIPTDLRATVLLAYGAQTLQAPGTTEAEQTSADSGALREVTESYNVDIANPDAVNVAAAHVQAAWASIAAAEVARIRHELVFYGATLARV